MPACSKMSRHDDMMRKQPIFVVTIVYDSIGLCLAMTVNSFEMLSVLL